MQITDQAKKQLDAIKDRTHCDAIKLVITELNNHYWLLLQGIKTATNTITYFAPFPCPADPHTAVLDHNGKTFVIN